MIDRFLEEDDYIEDPEMDCTKCGDPMEWINRLSQFECTSCERCVCFPEPGSNFDEVDDQQYAY